MSKALNEVVRRLSEAMVEGRLDERGPTAGLSAQDAEAVRLINGMIDALVAPLRMAEYALDEIAHGELPPFVIGEHQGEFDRIKQSINTLLAILYGMHGEMAHLIGAVGKGKLKTRGNDWDYQGIWRELIGGVNSSLDAVIAPINEAGEVLDRLARYDLKARMNGRYHGDHAVIRKAMNGTAQALNDAIAQVSDTVGVVSEVGGRITRVASSTAEGAVLQNRELAETSLNLTHLSESATESALKSREAHRDARQATETILVAKEAMDRMVASMDEISCAADSTAAMAGEIDEIAQQTGILAQGTVAKAARMRVSAGGFGVVAQEIRKLSRDCSDTAGIMKEFGQKLSPEHREEFEALVVRLFGIARFSNLLGVNAAIEAAHVEGAGNEFKVMTDEIHQLAVRSAEAAKSTGTLTGSSAALSRSGVALSREIDGQLEEAVRGARAISEFLDEHLEAVQGQTDRLGEISRAAAQIASGTEQNAAGAAESLTAAKGLEDQVAKLSRMVSRFDF